MSDRRVIFVGEKAPPTPTSKAVVKAMEDGDRELQAVAAAISRFVERRRSVPTTSSHIAQGLPEVNIQHLSM